MNTKPEPTQEVPTCTDVVRYENPDQIRLPRPARRTAEEMTRELRPECCRPRGGGR